MNANERECETGAIAKKAKTEVFTSPSLARIFPAEAPQPLFLINTLLQRGVPSPKSIRNRLNFNGFHSARETVETVPEILPARDTPLKRGVNESV